MKEKIKNSKLINIIMAIISYFSLSFLNVLPSYSIFSWIVLLCLILLFSKTDIHKKELKKEIIFLSIIFAFSLTFGHITYQYINDSSISIIRVFFKVSNLLSFIGMFNLIYIILINIIPKLNRYTILEKKSLFQNKVVLFIIVFSIIMICWLPYFLTYYPGVLTPDSLSELDIIINNFASMSDHHPIFHVLLISIPYKIGYSIFNNSMGAVGLCTLFQMCILDLIFTSFIVFLYNRKVNDKIMLGVILFYSILPMHGFYSITMWKDVLFAGVMLLFTMEVYKLLENKKSLKLKNYITFTLISLLVIFLRNNAIYMYIFFSFILIYIFKNKYKSFLVVFIFVFGIYFLVKGPVFDYYQITKSSSKEYIAIPLQQIGRMAFKDIKFTDEEQELLNKLMPIKIMKEAYSPYVSDGIKFHREYHEEVFDNNKIDYIMLWFKLVCKHPFTAIESYAVSTLGYWYPGVDYWVIASYIDENDYGLALTPKTEIFKSTIDKLSSKNMPLLNIEWSIGLCFWLILTFGVLTFKKRKSYILVYMPILGIWLTLMIASPVFAEFRYVYCAFASLPLLIITPYLKDKVSL